MWAAYWFLPRLVQVAMIQFRKLQDAGYKILHSFKSSGRVHGFALAYLAQDDSKVPGSPHDLVTRDLVVDYPTDFSAMPEKALNHLVKRGQQLMMAMVQEHCPGLVAWANATPSDDSEVAETV